MTILLWWVPTSLVVDRVPAGTRPVSLAGRSVIGTAWVAYVEGSVVSYDELLAAVHVWDGRALRQTVTDIWVDEPVSVAGGRALWGIPKDLAAFAALDGRTFGMGRVPTADAPVVPDVRATFTPLLRLPLRVRTAWHMVQQRQGRRFNTKVRLAGRLRLGRGRMVVRPDGHLGHLSGRRPFAAVHIADMAVTFGASQGGASR